MIPPVSVCHQLSWIGQPERLLAPQDDLGVERLADARDEAQRAQVVFVRDLRAGPHQHPQRRRRGVPHRHPLVLEHPVPAIGVEVALVDDRWSTPSVSGAMIP